MILSFHGRLWRRAIAGGLLLATLLAHSGAAKAQENNALAGKITELVDEVVSAEVELEVSMRRSKILRMKQDIFRVAIADPTILDFVAFGTREVEIIGKSTGTTTVTLWLGDEAAPRVLSMLVTVVKDDAVEDQRRIEFGEFSRMINEMFPNSRIQIIPIADKLIVRGEARDEEEAEKIISVITQQTGSSGGGAGGGGIIPTFFQGAAAEPFPGATGGGERIQVLNLLNIPGVKQVMLKVRIAELKRSAARELGTDFEFSIKEFMLSSVLAGGGNLLATGTFNDSSFDLVLKALLRNGSARILAEPNLVTLSGQSATFLSGGEFAVPTVVGVGGAQAATTSFKGFGTSIDFTPTVLDRDRIRLRVAPQFSTLNTANSVNGIFGVDTRTVNTTVELHEGQVLAIAGLIQEQQRGDTARLPLIGEIPVLNILTGTRSTSRDETELLILVTPELVHPLEPDQAPTILPGMEVTEPNDLDFSIYRDIEGRPDLHHRSTVWPLYKSRLKRCYDCESGHKSSKFFLKGLHGFTD